MLRLRRRGGSIRWNTKVAETLPVGVYSSPTVPEAVPPDVRFGYLVDHHEHAGDDCDPACRGCDSTDDASRDQGDRYRDEEDSVALLILCDLPIPFTDPVLEVDLVDHALCGRHHQAVGQPYLFAGVTLGLFPLPHSHGIPSGGCRCFDRHSTTPGPRWTGALGPSSGWTATGIDAGRARLSCA